MNERDDYNKDPLLNDPDNSDFSMKSNASAINKGPDVGLVSDFK